MSQKLKLLFILTGVAVIMIFLNKTVGAAYAPIWKPGPAAFILLFIAGIGLLVWEITNGDSQSNTHGSR